MKAFFQEMAGRIAEWRRELHRFPEVGMRLPRTAAWLEARLAEMGAPFRRIGDGLVADLPMQPPDGAGPPPPGIFAIRGDMDALPIHEENDVPYASTHPGAMHACGHDAHMAILLGIARWFTLHPAAFPVRLIFQPGEEGFAGAREMIRGGALEGVAAIVAVHVGELFPSIPPGHGGLRPGVMMASSDHFTLVFRGKGGHAATPHLTADPVVAAAQYVLAVQALRSRQLSPVHPAVISVCSVHGGSAHNVIPTEVILEGTVRTVTSRDQDFLRGRMETLARHAAGDAGLEAGLHWHESYPVVLNDPGVTGLVEGTARLCLGDAGVVALPDPSMGGEDMAFYLREVPGCLWSFTTHNPGKGITAPHHTPRFDVDDSLLWIPAWVMARSAGRFFGTDPDA